MLTTCLLCFYGVTFSQQLQFTLDKVVETNRELFPKRYKFALAAEGRYLYWIPSEEPKPISIKKGRYNRCLTAFKLDLKNTLPGNVARFDTISIFFQKSDTVYSITGYGNQFASVNGDYMMIACTDKHRVFKRNGNNSFEEVASIDASRFHLTSFFPYGKDYLLGAAIYNFGPETDLANLKLVKYDPGKRRIEKQVTNNAYEGIEFTHLVSRFIDSRNGMVAVANTLDYKIIIYNDQLMVTDSICRNIDLWKTYDHQINLEAYDTHAKNLIADLRKVNDSISRIEKIYFLNDSSLLVSYRPPDCDEQQLRMLDVWQKTMAGWKNIVSDQPIIFKRNDSDSISAASFIPDLTLSTPLLFTDSTAISVMVGNDVPEKTMLVGDYRKMLQQKYLKENITLKLFIYKWSIK